MKVDYRKLLKTIRHQNNKKCHIEPIERMLELFQCKWKVFGKSQNPIYLKAFYRLEDELENLKTDLNYYPL
jgi:hypothetical protein